VNAVKGHGGGMPLLKLLKTAVEDPWTQHFCEEGERFI